MKIVNKPFLQFIYSCLLCGVPQYSMNPLNQNRIEFVVKFYDNPI